MVVQKRDKIVIANELLFEQVLAYIEEGKQVAIPVKGMSMRPFLREGDGVVLKPFERKHLVRGLIVLAKVGNQVVLHRVVKYNKETIWLAGDGNLVQHEQVNYPDVRATASSLCRADTKIKLDQRWRCMLGQIWYWARPIRRIVMKLF